MDIKIIIKKLQECNINGILNQALSTTNEKREFDSSGATLAYDLRDKIKRIGNLHGLPIVFKSNKLVFVMSGIEFEIKSYNFKKKPSYENNQSMPKQRSLFENGDKNFVDLSSNIIIGHRTNGPRKKFNDIFLEYRAMDGLVYSVDLDTGIINTNIINADSNNEEVPTFFKPKNRDKRTENE